MHDDERWTLEPVQGRRAPSSSGERAAVGLGVFLVLAAAVFGVANLLDVDLRIAMDIRPTASAEPSATRTPRPTATPRPLREVSLELGTPRPMEWQGPGAAWIRANVDLPIVSSPTSGLEIGVLSVGDVAYVEIPEETDGSPAGWVMLSEPRYGSWIDIGEPESGRVEVFEQRWWGPIADVWRLAAGPDGFLAVGAIGDELTRGEGSSHFVSADGATWRRLPILAGRPWSGLVTHGPEGWLMASEDGEGAIWVARSADGTEWEWLGRLPGPGGGYPIDLAASATGYAMLALDWSSGLVRPWFSTDGIWWREGADPGFSFQHTVRIAPLLNGWYVWSGTGMSMGPGSGPDGAGAFSVDGRSWQPVEDGPTGINPQVAGEMGIAIDLDPSTRAVRVWHAGGSDRSIFWQRHPPDEESFAGGVVSALAGHDGRAWAFGWDRGTQGPLAWSFDGSGWHRDEVPPGLAVVPRLVAAGRAGVVALSGEFGERGIRPVLWHRGDDGDWHPEPEPIFPEPEPISADACGPLPSEAIELVVIEPAMAVACHGGRDLTFRAWSVECEGCYYFGDGSYEPAWLVAPTENQLFLSPIENGGQWLTAVLPPDLEPLPEWHEVWLEITAHYDDPASATCRSDPGIDEMAWFTGGQAVIDRCSQTLVVSAVRVIEPASPEP